MDTIEPIRNCLFDLCHPVDTLTTHCSKLSGKILQFYPTTTISLTLIVLKEKNPKQNPI